MFIFKIVSLFLTIFAGLSCLIRGFRGQRVTWKAMALFALGATGFITLQWLV